VKTDDRTSKTSTGKTIAAAKKFWAADPMGLRQSEVYFRTEDETTGTNRALVVTTPVLALVVEKAEHWQVARVRFGKDAATALRLVEKRKQPPALSPRAARAPKRPEPARSSASRKGPGRAA
jgi:hypothetical protein